MTLRRKKVQTILSGLLLLSLVGSDAVSQIARNGWTTHRGDEFFTARGSITLPPDKLFKKVILNVGSGFILPPVITEDSLVVLASQGSSQIKIYDSRDDTLFDVHQSTIKISGEIWASPILGQNRIAYVGDSHGYLYSAKIVRNQPEIVDVLRVNEEGGQIIRSATMSPDSAYLYVTDTQRWVYAIRTNDSGSLSESGVIKTRLGNSIKTHPVISNGRVYLGVSTGREHISKFIKVTMVQPGDDSSPDSLTHIGLEKEIEGSIIWLAGHPSVNKVWGGTDVWPFLYTFNSDAVREDVRPIPLELGSRGEHKELQLPVFDGENLLIPRKNEIKIINDENEWVCADAEIDMINDPVIDVSGNIYFTGDSSGQTALFVCNASDQRIKRIDNDNYNNSNSGAIGPDALYIPGNTTLYSFERFRGDTLYVDTSPFHSCIDSVVEVAAVVLDQARAPFSGQDILFSIAKGDDQPDSLIARKKTNVEGRAVLQWKLPRKTGPQILVVSGSGLKQRNSLRIDVRSPTIEGNAVIVFKPTPITERDSTRYWIHNASDSCTLRITGIALSNKDSDDYLVRHKKLPATVFPRDSLGIWIIFEPHTTGASLDSLLIASTDVVADTFAVGIEGVGISPIIARPTEFAFEQTSIGDTTVYRDTLRLTNTTQRILNVGINLSPPFFTPDANPFDIASFSDAFVTLGYGPGSADSSASQTVFVIDNSFLNPARVLLTGKGNDALRPTIIHERVRFAELGQSCEIIADADDNDSVPAKLRLFYREAGYGPYSGLDENAGYISKSFKNSSAEIPLDSVSQRGIEYFILASDRSDNLARRPTFDEETNDSLFYSIQVRLPVRTFLKAVPDTQFTMISFPYHIGELRLKDALPNIFSSIKRNEAFLWWVDSLRAKSNFPYLRLTRNNGNWIMRDGQSYILYSTDPIDVSGPPGLTSTTDSLFKYVLHPGWNAFAIPFNFRVPIVNIMPSRYRDKICALRNNTWQYLLTSDTLAPSEGYLLWNDTENQDALYILPSSETESSHAIHNTNATAKAIWFVRITASSGEAIDSDNYVGVIADANVEWDRYDLVEPPPVNKSISIHFRQDEWTLQRGLYTTDFRPPNENGYIWRFDVHTPNARQARLDFSNVDSIPNDTDAILVDLDSGEEQLLRYQKFHNVETQPDKPRRFALLIGTQDFFRADTDMLGPVPTEFELLGNFPNPFNLGTSIRFALPESGNITLMIYNIRGELVKNLVNNRLKGIGYHETTWDGTNEQGDPVASGVYLYRLSSNSISLCSKMAVIK